MNSFYIEEPGLIGQSARLLSEESRHAAQVMRMSAGEEIYAVDPTGKRFLAELTCVGKASCEALLKEQLPDNEPEICVTIYEGLPKADKLDTITQKCTELGAKRIVPVKMERSVVKLDAKDGEKRRERLEKIAREAAKQCKRGCAPEVKPPMTLKQLREGFIKHDLLLVPWEDANGYRFSDAHHDHPEAKNIGIVIGPEGGMSAEEVDYLTELGAKQITLGSRILRTETAAVVSCALVMQLWGDI